MNTLKTLTASAAVLLALVGTAQAQVNWGDKDYCRLASANVWPNILDAFENEMRSRTYQACMAGHPLMQNPAQSPPSQPADSPAVQACVDANIPDGHVSGAYIRDVYAACQASPSWRGYAR
jgi:hypothetical protein